jgi:hypothetical protein
MNTDSALDNLSHAAAIALLKRLYGVNDDIDGIIENHLEAADDVEIEGDGLYQSLQRQLKQIEAEDSYIGYYEVAGFSCRLQSLLIDIDTLMREQNPAKALDLLDKFLHMVEPIMERVDDSNGDIGSVFSEAVDQWLDTATEVRASNPDYLDWVKVVKDFFDNNEYGCLDDLMPNCHEFLSEEELRQMAEGFEQQARAALRVVPIKSKANGRSSYNSEVAHACIGLRSVGYALRDMSLVELATLLTSPEPNALQMEDLVKYAITMGNYQRAEYWLKQPGWENQCYRHRDLSCLLLKAQGKTKELKQALKHYYEEDPCLSTMQAYWEVCNVSERKRLRGQVEKRIAQQAISDGQAEEIIALLLFVGSTEMAGEILLTHAAAVVKVIWPTLTEWVAIFEENQQLLPTIICYRGLLNDILQRGNAKAYHHAARYFHKLLELDKSVQSYQNLDDSAAYIRQVQQQHWRKRSFWAEADYPNKPS